MSRTLFTSRDGGDLKLPANREFLKRSLSLSTLHFMQQTHSDVVRPVDATGNNFECDAMVTATPGVGLAALAADCMPITFSSETVVGVAHVGRLGLGSQIAVKTVAAMRHLGAMNIFATIGPSICSECYEVSPEMYRDFVARIPQSSTSELEHKLNLQRGVQGQLKEVGVSVLDLERCTFENPGYFSYRRGGEHARAAGVISL